jgi:hypothetical protein
MGCLTQMLITAGKLKQIIITVSRSRSVWKKEIETDYKEIECNWLRVGFNGKGFTS